MPLSNNASLSIEKLSLFKTHVPLPPLLQRHRRLLLVCAVAVVLLTFTFLSPSTTPLQSSYIHPFSHGSILDAAQPTDISVCNLVSADIIAELHNSEEYSIYTFNNGSPLKPGQVLRAPSRLCIIVAVPQSPILDGRYPDLPREGHGPDSIHFLIDSGDVIMTFPPLRPLPNQPKAQEQISSKAVLYHVDPIFLSQGEYYMYAEREWSNWRWAQEWGMDNVTGKYIYRQPPIPDAVGDDHKWYPRKFATPNMHPPFIRIDGPHGPPANRPMCDNNVTASQGRWYRVDKANVGTKENPTRLVDEWGYKWEGDRCRMEYYDQLDVFDCLSGKNIHDYGASNSRRLAKMMITGGEWCKSSTDWKCQDQDDDHFGNIEKFLLEPTADGKEKIVAADEPRGQYFRNDFEKGEDTPDLHFGRNSTLHFKFITSISNDTSVWMDELYDRADLDRHNVSDAATVWQDRTVHPGAKARAPVAKHGKPDLVMIATGTWDSVFVNWFSSFEESMPKYRDAFMGAYADMDIPIILHLSPSLCCRETDYWYRRYTGARLQTFDDIARQTFGVDDATAKAAGGRMDVLDPLHMNGRPEVVWDYGPSGGNHFRAEHQVTEMQMLLNSICVRDVNTGKAVFRRDLERMQEQDVV